jgi:hypothetical protein
VHQIDRQAQIHRENPAAEHKTTEWLPKPVRSQLRRCVERGCEASGRGSVASAQFRDDTGINFRLRGGASALIRGDVRSTRRTMG